MHHFWNWCVIQSIHKAKGIFRMLKKKICNSFNKFPRTNNELFYKYKNNNDKVNVIPYQKVN